MVPDIVKWVANLAKSPKKKKSKVEKAEDVIEAETSKSVDEVAKTAEAEVVPTEDVAPAKDIEAEAKDDAATATKDTDDAPTDEVADKANVEETTVEDTEAKDNETVDAEVAEDAEIVEEIAPEPAVVPAEAKEGSGFFPLLLGGVIAGVIGFGIATFLQPEDNTAQMTELLNSQAEQIADLQTQLENLPTPDVSDQIAAGLGGVSDQITDIQDRLQRVERQPNADGTLSETALAAYQAELDALRAELDEQQSAVMSAASQAGADLAAARAEAERLEQEALAAAEAAVARAAINRIATAVDTGAPFADAIGDLDTSDVPAAFMDAAETGVATNAELNEDFPAVARAALATARSEGESDDAGGLSGFLLSQFDVRSTSPQEGSSPDAILSRAEAAVKEGRVADALAEIEALPEVARAEITEWTARAQERADVLDAIAILSETYQ